MIIFLNGFLLTSFLFKATTSIDFSQFKNLFFNFFKKLNLFFFISYENLTFKKFCKFFLPVTYKFNIKKNSFKVFIFSFFLLSQLRFFPKLLKFLIKKDQRSNNTKSWLYLPSKLNKFLSLNTTPNSSLFLKNFKTQYLVKFKPSSFVKLINSENYTIFFIRKNKIFNKGRYSRNRQLYRTGVYWCIWLSVFFGYCLYFSFYRFTLNFGYQWWLVFSFLFLFINQKMWKYHFYNLFVIFGELKKNFNWISITFVSLKNLLK